MCVTTTMKDTFDAHVHSDTWVDGRMDDKHAGIRRMQRPGRILRISELGLECICGTGARA